jgi:uncharacterized protein (TIGR03790 family)
MKTACALFTTILFLAALPLRGADSGNEVIVVYNTRMPESGELARYYASKRNVPTNQIFGFDLSTGQEMTRGEFRESLQKPLAKALDAQKLWRMGTVIMPATTNTPGRVIWKVTESKIRYAVLCYGVPVSIAKDPNLKERGDEKLRPEMRRDEAAVDTELALLPMIEENLPLEGPLGNPLFGVTNAALCDPTNGVLMVTRLDGPTAEIARGLVDKALEAETNGLWGRAYFDLRNITDPGYKQGDDWIRGASEICKRLGFETVVDNKSETFPAEFPMSHIAFYCGWYDATVSGPFTRSHVEFVPGAFAYHLHSFSAVHLRSATQDWVGPLLAKGATITMGCVYEPYLTGTPQVAVFAARLIFDRMTFGESAYAAQPVLSWQTTIVGDPLYRPFGQSPEQLHEQFQRKHSPLLEWFHLRILNVSLGKGASLIMGATYLEQLELTRHSAVLSEKLADLYESLGKPSSAIELYDQALKLDPSPQQRVRLRLALGEKLAASNFHEKASNEYTALLQENPDYPNKTDLYRKLLALARKLGRNEDAAKYEQVINLLNPPPPPPPATPATNHN